MCDMYGILAHPHAYKHRTEETKAQIGTHGALAHPDCNKKHATCIALSTSQRRLSHMACWHFLMSANTQLKRATPEIYGTLVQSHTDKYGAESSITRDRLAYMALAHVSKHTTIARYHTSIWHSMHGMLAHPQVDELNAAASDNRVPGTHGTLAQKLVVKDFTEASNTRTFLAHMIGWRIFVLVDT